uniref:Anion exchange protein n=1 Tax=Paramormyrops kingsleyae TaxID=1676925 RepID=A0A3B3SWA0_9TELE
MSVSVLPPPQLVDRAPLLLQVLPNEEKGSHDGSEEEAWEKALSVERFGDIIAKPVAANVEKMGRSYGERDFEYHRHTFHHTHHPLSTHLPPPTRVRKRALGTDRRRKKKRKKKRTSVPPSEVTPTIHEVDEEEESDAEGRGQVSRPTERADCDIEVAHPFGEAAITCRFSSTPEPPSALTRAWFRRKSIHRLAGAQRASYDLRERICIGSMTTAGGGAVYHKVPTDEAEAQMLASADLDDMKSHRFEDNPGVRRHLVKKQSRSQVSRTNNSSPSHLLSSLSKRRKSDRKTHEVFVELNELMMDKDQELHWKETARWIKFEEDVEEETERWGKPHVASLTFRSLLELRRTIAHGAVLLDLDQTTLPGIAHLVVETMIITDQIRAVDRPNMLRVLLLKHSHPNDEKDGFFPRHPSVHSMGSFHRNHNQLPDTSLPLVTEDHADSHAFLLGRTHGAGSSDMFCDLTGCVEFLEQPASAFVRLSEAVLLESILEVPVPVRFLFVLLGPAQSSMDYHEIGRSISTLMSDKNFHEVAYFADDRQDLLSGINEFLDYSIVLPPSDVEGKDLLKTVASFQRKMIRKRKEREKKFVSITTASEVEARGKDVSLDEQEDEEQDVDPMKRSGVPFGGLLHDIRRRYPHYMSDLKDALDTQCAAAVIFIYFAALSPTIAFGGMLGEKTEGLMGVSELIISTAVLGVIFSLLAGQPLLIIGFSGPLLVFEEAFFKFCQAQGLEYLTGRVWIGFWLISIVLIIVAAEGSFLVRYISPFTQEIFAFLISLIFIFESFSKLIKVFQEHPLMRNNPLPSSPSSLGFSNYSWELDIEANHNAQVTQPNTALLSLVLVLGTFFVAFFFRKFRNSRFLGGKARRIIGDFGMPISILCSVIVDYIIPDADTQKLNVPTGFSVTSPDKRGWFISPFGDKQTFPMWMMAASIVPALLVFILIFMETQITSLIVSKKERHLVKGSGFHLDLLLIILLGALCPLFGLPWLTAATLRSITHVNALTVMSTATAPGERPVIQEVKEQRLTGMAVALLMGMSGVMTNVLCHIPLAVIFGIFLYMGVTSLTGIQLYERVMLMVTPAKHHPDHVYVTKVKTWRMNMFTVIQLTCIMLLWVVKSTVASLAFPFVLILTVPLRRLVLTRIFKERELKALDSDVDSPNFDEDGRDEYDELHMPV